MAKAWSRHEMRRHHTEMQRLVEISRCRDDALAQLEAVSPELHAQALVQDTTLWPHRWKPMTVTPAIPGYNAQGTRTEK